MAAAADKVVSAGLAEQLRGLAWSYGSDIMKKVTPILQKNGDDVKQLEELLLAIKEWLKEQDADLYPKLLVFIEDHKKAQRAV